MTALILASVPAAASPDGAATPEPSAAPDTRVTTTESRCKNIGRGLASGVQTARSKDIGFDDCPAPAGLHWPAAFKESRELDPHRAAATQLATNMCLKLFERGR